ncbi:MAG TPA: MerR family transcriptional regulator [Trinickia sp.]
MSEALTIGRMAEALGVTTHTLRYYEQAGLIRPVSRSAAGHRLYAPADIEWLRFVMRLKATGMPIAGMQAIAALRAKGVETAAERRALLIEHREAVKAELQQWQANLAAIEDKILAYDAMIANAANATNATTAADDMTNDKAKPQSSKDRPWQSKRTQTTTATHVDGTSSRKSTGKPASA